MKVDAYQPPKSDLGGNRKKPGSGFKAVIYGTLIEIFGSLIVGLSIGLAYGFILAAKGMSAEVIQAKMEHMEIVSIVGLLSTAAGFLVSIFAGYICARIVNSASYTPVYILAGITFTLAVITGIGSDGWYVVILMAVLSAASIIVGARIYNRTLTSS